MNDELFLKSQFCSSSAHVGRHLFENCIKTFLKNKMVILVTHQLQYLPSVDQILLLEDGKVQAVGTYDYLKETGLDFAKLLPEKEKAATDTEEEGKRRRTLSNSSKEKNIYRRQNSVSSTSSLESKDIEEEIEIGKPNEEEKSKEGAVGWDIYK